MDWFRTIEFAVSPVLVPSMVGAERSWDGLKPKIDLFVYASAAVFSSLNWTTKFTTSL